MGNYPTMSEASIKSYLIRGAARNPSLTYPNKEFGYGTGSAADIFTAAGVIEFHTQFILSFSYLDQGPPFFSR